MSWFSQICLKLFLQFWGIVKAMFCYSEAIWCYFGGYVWAYFGQFWSYVGLFSHNADFIVEHMFGFFCAILSLLFDVSLAYFDRVLRLCLSIYYFETIFEAMFMTGWAILCYFEMMLKLVWSDSSNVFHVIFEHMLG